MGNAISQGVGVALGMQDRFSWAAVAAAGAGAAAGRAVGNWATGTAENPGWKYAIASATGSTTLANMAAVGASGMADAVVQGAVRSLIDGSDFGDNVRAALPSVIGNMMATGIMAMIENACFVAGTLVQTPTGLKPIEELKAGDWVFARDEHARTDTIHRRQILETYRFEDKATLIVTFETADGPVSVRTTALHPFHVEGQGWTAAEDLVAGAKISVMNRSAPATVLSLNPDAGITSVFNFAVEVDHTYFVEHTGLWVHNVCQAEPVSGETVVVSGDRPANPPEMRLARLSERQVRLLWAAGQSEEQIQALDAELSHRRNTRTVSPTLSVEDTDRIAALSELGYSSEQIGQLRRLPANVLSSLIDLNPTVIEVRAKVELGTWSSDRAALTGGRLTASEYRLAAFTGTWSRFQAMSAESGAIRSDRDIARSGGALAPQTATPLTTPDDPAQIGFVRSIADATILPQVLGDRERMITVGRHDGELYVTGMFLLGTQGARLTIPAGYVAIVHTHPAADMNPRPHARDNLVPTQLGRPNFVVSRNRGTTNLWEAGSINGVGVIRRHDANGHSTAWQPFHSDLAKYKN